MIFSLFVLLMVYFINLLAPIRLNKTVFLKENTVTLLIWPYPLLVILPYLSHIGHMHSLPRFFLLIVFPPLYEIMFLLGNFYLVMIQITNLSRLLVMLVTLFYAHIPPINFLFDLLNVFFLVMPLMLRAIFVLIQFPLVYIRLVMLFLTKPLFHFLILPILLHLLHHPPSLILG